MWSGEPEAAVVDTGGRAGGSARGRVHLGRSASVTDLGFCAPYVSGRGYGGSLWCDHCRRGPKAPGYSYEAPSRGLQWSARQEPASAGFVRVAGG